MYSIGSERLRNGIYVEVKISKTKWRLKHQLIWEAANGPIPDGYCICFIDENNRNFNIANLKSLPLKEHLRGKRLQEKRQKTQQARWQIKYPVGSERFDHFKYIWIKVGSPHGWLPKHHLIWEAANGPIPVDHMIIFIDGDKRNFRLDNLKARPKFSTVGAEKLAHSGKFIMVKIAEPDSWALKHHLIWEAANGPLPDGHGISFADGSSHNLALDNLVLLSYSERSYMSTTGLFQTAVTPELFKTTAALAKLSLATKNRRKEQSSKRD